ncbi:hypothetical protein AJ79_04923 [Helicocarpus griseus UAMH5409]|uniref:Cytochrome P450 n=1 Tax=Helicocarpus griseus UAMH5409 TaxID=1447875 RepID=A0A2B7XS18_9EURO|nr:hypothetical protein AJ79_04923 [Helicocarpus griseus UAMH5409]
MGREFQIRAPQTLETLGAAIAVWVFYLVCLAVYRLYLSPLARFPGPKLAALSRWYEAYYDIILGGQYYRNVDKLHDMYGPIVRIAPDELHIRDSQFYEQFYGQNQKLDKPGWDAKFGVKESGFTTPGHALHRERRGALRRMFSRRMILSFEPVIRERAERLCEKFLDYAETSQPLVIPDAYPCYTGDIMLQFAFGLRYKQIESANFEKSFHKAFKTMGASGHVIAQFPWIAPLMDALPDTLLERIQPALEHMLQMKRDVRSLIERTVRGEDFADKSVTHPTIFQEILQSDIRPQEKSQQRLFDEAQIVVGAGIETTAYALTVATFHIVNNPRIYQKLREELVQAIPDINAPPTLLELEKLPYLTGCIMECLRLSYGLTGRNPRSRDQPLKYGDWVIPAKTIVTMCIADVHHDESIFPDSRSFIPERWLDDPLAPDGTPLDRYLVSFGRGLRSCLGINLAWAELYTVLGLVFRRMDFKLYKTDISDVEMEHDNFVPHVRVESEGVRVLVSKVSA